MMRKDPNLREIIEIYLQVILIFIFVFIVVYLFVGQLFEVTGDSMLPNFKDKEQVIGEKLSVKFSNLERGDIIIFKSPKEDNRLLIKRIIGLPNEEFQIKDGYLYINGKLLTETYLKDNTLTTGLRILEDDFEYKIPIDSYIVLGDNRDQSTDSREWGYVRTDSIVARAIIVYYPLKNFRLIEKVKY